MCTVLNSFSFRQTSPKTLEQYTLSAPSEILKNQSISRFMARQNSSVRRVRPRRKSKGFKVVTNSLTWRWSGNPSVIESGEPWYCSKVIFRHSLVIALFTRRVELCPLHTSPVADWRECRGGWVYFLAEVLCWPFCLLFEMTLNILDITRPSSPADTIRPGCWNWKLKPAVKLRLPAAPPARLQGVQTWCHGANDSIIWYYYRCRCPYLTSESDAGSFLPVFRLTEGVTPCVSDVLIWNVLRWLDGYISCCRDIYIKRYFQPFFAVFFC